MNQEFRKMMLLAAAASLCVPVVSAQNTTSEDKPKATINDRRENQQERIGEGIENGSLTAGEAARLEHKEAKVNAEIHQMKSDGEFTKGERAKVQAQQSALSKQIYQQKHDAQKQNVNPTTQVGQRQRNQQLRVAEGVKNGSLNAREASRMERREAGVSREVAAMRSANGGTLTKGERRLVNHQQNKNSKAIYRQKHDAQHR
jgi:hypothetical protein